MTTRTVTSAVAEPAGPRERFGWAPLLVLLTGTFMTFLDKTNGSLTRIGAGQ